MSHPPTLGIVYAGSAAFAIPALRMLHHSGHRLITVLTQPDKPAGRGRRMQEVPIKSCAREYDIPCLQPETLHDPQLLQQLSNWQPDLLLVAAYGRLLPSAYLQLPRLGAVNLHASLLPRWRGASPIQHALLAGDQQSGVSLMQMDEGLDTGPILAQCTVALDKPYNSAELEAELAEKAAQLLRHQLPNIAAGRLPKKPQDSTLACYAARIKKSAGQIDWQQSATEIERQIRALNPWPVAHTLYRGQALRIWQADAVPPTAAALKCGQIGLSRQQGLLVGTASGCLRLGRIQNPSKGVIAALPWGLSQKLDGQYFGI